MIFSSVVVGNFVAIELRTVVSDSFSIIGCSLLASVLLSLFNVVVMMGTYLTVVVSGLCDDNSETEGGNDGGVEDGDEDDG